MELNYDELIQNFCAFTMNPNTDIAVQYLTQANWDLTLAYNLYSAQIPVHEEEHREVFARPANAGNREVAANVQIDEGWGVMTIPYMVGGFVKSTLSSIYSYFFPPRLDTFQGYLLSQAFQSPKMTALPLPGAIQYALDRGKRTLIYLHNEAYGEQFIQQVLCDRQSISIINDIYVLYAHYANSEQGQEIINLLAHGQDMVFAVIQGEEIIGKLENLPTLDQFLQFLVGYSGDTQSREVRQIQDRIIRKQQESDLQEAERIVLQRAENELKAIQEQERKKTQELEEKAKKESEIKRRLDLIGEEPPAGPNVSTISFRLPSGEKIDRRFNNSIEINLLYCYIESKGLANFELVFGYPSIVLKDGTIESQNMNPRALVHVRLIE